MEKITTQKENNDGAPFNGDIHLEAEFLRLKAKHNVTHVIETGTFMGHTTKWLAQHFGKVVTIESMARYRDEAMKLLMSDGDKPNVVSVLGDSSKDLGHIIRDNYTVGGSLLLFLDAHWYANPVLKELEQIAECNMSTKPIIAIHDFKVPDRPDFGYDEYPDQKIVYEFKWIKGHLDKIYPDGYHWWYNREAVGAKRGCLFVAPGEIEGTTDAVEN